jgi:hypothetical protein
MDPPLLWCPSSGRIAKQRRSFDRIYWASGFPLIRRENGPQRESTTCPTAHIFACSFVTNLRNLLRKSIMEQIGHSASDAHALAHDRSIYSVASFNSILDSSLILLYGLWFFLLLSSCTTLNSNCVVSVFAMCAVIVLCDSTASSLLVLQKHKIRRLNSSDICFLNSLS